MASKTPKKLKPGDVKVTVRQIAELRHAEYNPRYMTEEDRASIKASLTEFGVVDPAVINTHPDRENVIVGGNQRITVAREDLKWSTFPCVHVKLDSEAEKRLNVRLNKNQGRWDWDMLKEFGPEFLQGVGFTEEELAGRFDDLSLKLNEGIGGNKDQLRQPVGNVLMWLNKWNMSIGSSLLTEKIFAFFRYAEAKESELDEETFKALREGYEQVLQDRLEDALDSILPQEFLAEAEDNA
jgi:hypothetical protein